MKGVLHWMNSRCSGASKEKSLAVQQSNEPTLGLDCIARLANSFISNVRCSVVGVW